jgi:hypothetical protein
MHNFQPFSEKFLGPVKRIENKKKTRYHFSGLIHDKEISTSDFTALGVLFLVKDSIATKTQIWNFEGQEYTSIWSWEDREKFSVLLDSTPSAHHRRFKNTKSRKGYLFTKWKIGKKEFSLVRRFSVITFKYKMNIHLYHDDINTTALEKTPSVYAEKREAALREACESCNISSTLPTIVLGYIEIYIETFSQKYSSDLNFRPDSEYFTWLQENIENSDENLIIGEKDFQCPILPSKFSDIEFRKEALRFDQELKRFNNKYSSVKKKIQKSKKKFFPVSFMGRRDFIPTHILSHQSRLLCSLFFPISCLHPRLLQKNPRLV